jgi:hypothetical protein
MFFSFFFFFFLFPSFSFPLAVYGRVFYCFGKRGYVMVGELKRENGFLDVVLREDLTFFFFPRGRGAERVR